VPSIGLVFERTETHPQKIIVPNLGEFRLSGISNRLIKYLLPSIFRFHSGEAGSAELRNFVRIYIELQPHPSATSLSERNFCRRHYILSISGGSMSSARLAGPFHAQFWFGIKSRGWVSFHLVLALALARPGEIAQ
jgi:hypothetical protein